MGYSDHHTGMGIQLAYLRNSNNYSLSTDEAYSWLFENCHKYGFVIRYPEGKSDITGVSDYTDYFRYVGVAHATYMKANDLCLEEYVTLLKGYTDDKPLKINGADGRYYEVWYVAVEGSATVKHPTNYAYTVSGTNDGGVVVTVIAPRLWSPRLSLPPIPRQADLTNGYAFGTRVPFPQRDAERGCFVIVNSKRRC